MIWSNFKQDPPEFAALGEERLERTGLVPTHIALPIVTFPHPGTEVFFNVSGDSMRTTADWLQSWLSHHRPLYGLGAPKRSRTYQAILTFLICV